MSPRDDRQQLLDDLSAITLTDAELTALAYHLAANRLDDVGEDWLDWEDAPLLDEYTLNELCARIQQRITDVIREHAGELGPAVYERCDL